MPSDLHLAHFDAQDRLTDPAPPELQEIVRGAQQRPLTGTCLLTAQHTQAHAVPLTRHDMRVPGTSPLINVQRMDISAYIRCHGSLCNGLSCFRNLTLSRSRVKLIGAGSSALRAAKEYGVRFMAVEQDDPLGGSIYHSPRQELALPVTRVWRTTR